MNKIDGKTLDPDIARLMREFLKPWEIAETAIRLGYESILDPHELTQITEENIKRAYATAKIRIERTMLYTFLLLDLVLMFVLIQALYLREGSVAKNHPVLVRKGKAIILL